MGLAIEHAIGFGPSTKSLYRQELGTPMKRVTAQQMSDISSFLSRVIKEHDEKVRSIVEASIKDPDNIGATVSDIAAESRLFALRCHQLKMHFDWSISPTPEWFDHFIDQYYQLPDTGSTLFAERGVYGSLAVKRGGRLLELCCGDGYNARHFYAPMAATVISVDFDTAAIDHAKKYNSLHNIEFRVADIRTQMPSGEFDNVVWDAAIEHFTEEEISDIMSGIKLRLTRNGILSGYTIVEKADGKHLHEHEREFRSKEDLASFLTPHFSNVRVFETMHPNRHNLYFWASDAKLPFDNEWDEALQVRR